MSDDTVLQVSTLPGALADDAVRVVVLDHTGRVSCSGMDLAEATGGATGDQGVRELPEPSGDGVALAETGGRRRLRAGAPMVPHVAHRLMLTGEVFDAVLGPPAG